MHDLDRTLRTSEPELDELFGEAYDDDELYDGEMDAYGDDDEIYEAAAMDGVLSEEEELMLAEELLSLSSEEELDQFLGKLFKRVRRGARRIGRKVRGVARRAGRAFRPLGRLLKPVAKRLLPIAGGAVGTFFGGPAGGAIGGKLGSFASRLFEIDVEEMDVEELELEVARRYVRLAADAAHEVAMAPESGGSPEQVARAALAAAAQRHAPGLVSGKAKGKGCSCGGGSGSRSGRWVRRGRKIVLIGA